MSDPAPLRKMLAALLTMLAPSNSMSPFANALYVPPVRVLVAPFQFFKAPAPWICSVSEALACTVPLLVKPPAFGRMTIPTD